VGAVVRDVEVAASSSVSAVSVGGHEPMIGGGLFPPIHSKDMDGEDRTLPTRLMPQGVSMV
jgi:hypothetical protein